MPNTLTEWLAVWFIVAVAIAPFIGSLLGKLRTRREFQAHLATEARRVRLEKLVDLADEYDAAPTDKDRQRIFIKAEALGFTDDAKPFALDYRALVGNVADEMDKAGKPTPPRAA